MAKKQTIITQDVPDDDPNLNHDEDLELDDGPGAQIQNLRAQFGPTGLLLKVYKIIPGSKPQFCFKSQDNSDIEEEIQTRYGGGKYAVRAFSDGKLLDTIYTDVAEPSIISGHGGNKGTGGGDVNERLFLLMQQQNQQLTSMMMAALGRPGPVGGDMNQTLLEHLLNNKSNTGSEGIVGKILDKALDSLEAKTEGGDWKSEAIKGVREIVSGALPILPHVLGMPGGGPVPMVTPTPHTNGNGGGQLPPTPQLTGAPMPSDDIMYLRQTMATLKPKIMSGMLPAELALDWIFANSQDPMFQPFLKLAITKTPEEIMELDPDLKTTPFKEWISTVMQGIKDAYKEQESGS